MSRAMFARITVGFGTNQILFSQNGLLLLPGLIAINIHALTRVYAMACMCARGNFPELHNREYWVCGLPG